MFEYITEDIKQIPLKDRRKIEKKIYPEFFKGILEHTKTFELRKDNDEYHPGDILILREWDGENYTGNSVRREITSILRGCPEYGLMDGYCILSLWVPGFYNRAKACLDELEKSNGRENEI